MSNMIVMRMSKP